MCIAVLYIAVFQHCDINMDKNLSGTKQTDLLTINC